MIACSRRSRVAHVSAFGIVCLIACSSGDEHDLVVQAVSEYGGTPIQGVQVQVNELPWIATGADGKARFGRVDPPFTVRAYQTMTNPTGTSRFDDVWELPGLETNPVVLRADGSPGLPFGPSEHHASIAGTVSGLSGGSGSLVQVGAAAPPPAYRGVPTTAAADGAFEITRAAWEGRSAQTFVVHALESDAANPPTHYLGHGSASVAASDPTGEGGEVTGLPVKLGPVAEARIAGSVTLPAALAGAEVSPSLGIEFPDASSLDLVRWSAGGPAPPSPGLPGSFDYAVPLVGGRAASIGFSASASPTGPSASEHREVRIPEGASVSGLTFDLPAPVSLVEPADGAGIASGTVFRWTPGPADGRYVLHVLCQQVESASTRFVHFRAIETTATEARLPSIPFFALTPGATCSWNVEWYDGPASGALGAVTGRTFGRSSRCESRAVTFE